MCLAQGHIIVTPVRLELAAPQSQVKHSTTEPLCSHSNSVDPDHIAPEGSSLTWVYTACAGL